MNTTRKSLTFVALFLGVSSIARPVAAQAPDVSARIGPSFRPESFFLGRTEGTGSLKVMFKRSHTVRVHGHGQLASDGVLLLDQDIEQTGKPVKHRRWMMRSVGGGRYSATLTDATGPVIGTVNGNVMHLAFPAKGGLRIRQVITLANDGRSARNRLTIRKFGIVVATLSETIKRIDRRNAQRRSNPM